MAEQSLNKYEEVTFDEVYDGMMSINYLEKTHKEMADRLKNSKPYKAMMEMSERNFYNSNYNAPFQDIQSTKEKIKEVGSLALDFDFCVSNTLSRLVNLEAKCFVDTFIKRASTLKQIDETDQSPPPKKKTKRSDANISKKSPEPISEVKDMKKDDIDTDSSVHTSDLSSFEDEVVIPPEDETVDKKPKILSFKTVNQAYKSMVSKRQSLTKREKNSRKSSKVGSNGSVKSESCESLPKRIPKPNAKYLSMDD